METKTKTIARVNNVSIIVGNDENEMVPIRPICEALGIDAEAQRQKIQNHDLLSSTALLSKVVASDGKNQENRLHDEEYWAQVIEELAIEEEEDVEELLEKISNQQQQ